MHIEVFGYFRVDCRVIKRVFILKGKKPEDNGKNSFILYEWECRRCFSSYLISFFFMNSIRFEEECWNEWMSKQIPSFQSIPAKRVVPQRERETIEMFTVKKFDIWSEGLTVLSWVFEHLKAEKRLNEMRTKRTRRFLREEYTSLQTNEPEILIYSHWICQFRIKYVLKLRTTLVKLIPWKIRIYCTDENKQEKRQRILTETIEATKAIYCLLVNQKSANH